MDWEESTKNRPRPQSIIHSLCRLYYIAGKLRCHFVAPEQSVFSKPAGRQSDQWWDGDGRKFWRKKKNDDAAPVFWPRKRLHALLWPQYDGVLEYSNTTIPRSTRILQYQYHNMYQYRNTTKYSSRGNLVQGSFENSRSSMHIMQTSQNSEGEKISFYKSFFFLPNQMWPICIVRGRENNTQTWSS